jgi:hypothetical protein
MLIGWRSAHASRSRGRLDRIPTPAAGGLARWDVPASLSLPVVVVRERSSPMVPSFDKGRGRKKSLTIRPFATPAYVLVSTSAGGSSRRLRPCRSVRPAGQRKSPTVTAIRLGVRATERGALSRSTGCRSPTLLLPLPREITGPAAVIDLRDAVLTAFMPPHRARQSPSVAWRRNQVSRFFRLGCVRDSQRSRHATCPRAPSCTSIPRYPISRWVAKDRQMFFCTATTTPRIIASTSVRATRL